MARKLGQLNEAIRKHCTDLHYVDHREHDDRERVHSNYRYVLINLYGYPGSHPKARIDAYYLNPRNRDCRLQIDSLPPRPSLLCARSGLRLRMTISFHLNHSPNCVCYENPALHRRFTDDAFRSRPECQGAEQSRPGQLYYSGTGIAFCR